MTDNPDATDRTSNVASMPDRRTPRDGVEGASRPSRRLLIFALAMWGLLAVAIPLAALTLNAVTIAGFPLGLWLTAQGVLAALAGLAIWFAIRARGTPSGDRRSEPFTFAGETIGAAGVLGFTGAIAALGYDGLSLPLGVVAGLALMTILIAPRFVLYPVTTVSGYFAIRYGGVWPRRAALVVMAMASVWLLAADLRGGALALQGLLQTDYASAVALATVAVAILWLATTIVRTPQRTGLVYVGVVVAFGAVLTALAGRNGGLSVPYFSFGQALGDLAAVEQKLMLDKLSDIKSLRPMASPFLQLSMINFAAVVVAVALGIAALPHLLGRHASAATVAAGDAARRTGYTTALLAVFLMGLASFAVYARLGVAELIASGIENASVPDALIQARSLGWLDICGPAPSSPQVPVATSIPGMAATAASDVAAACAKASGQRGFLRMQDLAFTSDSFVVAAPLVIGLPGWSTIALWGAGLLAALATGNALLSGLVAAGSEARGGHVPALPNRMAARNEQSRPIMVAIDVRSVVIAIGLLLTASLLAVIGSIEIPSLVSEGLAMIAAGLFPALALGLYWRGMTAAGAITSMIVGGGLVVGYIVGVRMFPVAMVEWFGLLSNAAPNAMRKFEMLKDAVSAAPTDELRQIARTNLTRHASTIAGWWGLRPPASVVFALPAAFAAGIAVSRLSARSR